MSNTKFRYVITGRSSDSSLDLPESDKLSVLTPLDRGLLIEAEADSAEALAARGLRVKQLRAPHTINIFSYRIDTDSGKTPDLPEAFTTPGNGMSPETDDNRHHIVQFIGPVQESWLATVNERGVEIVEAISPYAYLVRGEADTVRALRGLAFVAWTGPFEPAYKVNPQLLDPALLEAPDGTEEPQPRPDGLGEIEAINIGVFADGDVDAVAALIEELGGTVTEITQPTTDIYRNITASLLPPAALATLAARSDVRWVDLVRRPVLEDERAAQIAYEDLNGTAAPNTVPLTGYANNLTALAVTGAGVTIAICDTGIDTNTAATMHADLAGRLAFAVNATGANLTTGDTDGHGTHVAGIAAGNAATGNTDPQGFLLGQGMAPGARVGSLLANGTRQQRIQQAAQQAASVMNNSYALDGDNYGAGDRTFDLGVRDADPTTTDTDPLVVVFSAGNSGPGGSSCTKAVKNALVVGNSLNARPAEGDIDDIRGLRTSSSRGPAGDGRLMPTLSAPGTDIVSARSTSSSRPQYVDTGGTTHSQYTSMSGTSMAAPVVSGMCALLIDWWRQTRGGETPSPALLKAFLVVSTESMVGGPDRNGGTIADVPNNDVGWGRVSLENTLLQSPASDRGPKIFVDQRHAFTATGQEYRIRVSAADPTLPLRIAVAWTDAAGAVGANPALVNDLDLEVLEVDSGNVFRGNVFANGFSATGGASDALNNLECVFIQNPTGIYEVSVVAANITASARPDIATPWQDFGMVVDNGEVPSADPVSVVAVLDRSGSMQSYGYVDVTRQTSRQFVDLMSIDDSVGVVSFGSTGNREYPTSGGPVQITDQTVRTAATNAIDNIAFGGCTFMGDGIQTAGSMLAGAGTRRAMVLLSDGYDNKGCDEGNPAKPSALDAAATLPADLPIYSCAMGPASDQDLLGQLAATTDGRYYYMPTIDDLFEIYNYIRGQVTGEGIIVNESSMASRSTVRGFVDACTDSVVFTVAWHDESLKYVARSPRSERDIAIRLRSPGGRWLPYSATEVIRTVGSGYVSLRIQDPQPGMWTVEVATARDQHTPYTVGGFVRSDINLLFGAPSRILVGQPLNLRAAVTDKKGAVNGLQVTATALSPAQRVDDLLREYGRQLVTVDLPHTILKDGEPDDRRLALARLVLLRDQLRKKTGKDILAPRVAKVSMGSKSSYSSALTDLLRNGSRDIATHALSLGGRTVSAATAPPSVRPPVIRNTGDLSNGLGKVLDWRKVVRPVQPGIAVGRVDDTRIPGSYTFRIRAVGYSPVCRTRFVRLDQLSVSVLEKLG